MQPYLFCIWAEDFVLKTFLVNATNDDQAIDAILLHLCLPTDLIAQFCVMTNQLTLDDPTDTPIGTVKAIQLLPPPTLL